MAAKQGIRFKLKSVTNKAKYKVKYTLSQIKKTSRNKYTYSKKIVPIKKKKYSYKK